MKSSYHTILILNAANKLFFQEFVSVTLCLYSYISFQKGNSNLSACFVIVHLTSQYNYLTSPINKTYVYFWSVPTHFPRGTYFLITYSLCKTFLKKVNINDILQFLQECDFYNKI